MPAGVVGVAADRPRPAVPAALTAGVPLLALLLSVQLLLRPHQLPLLLLPLPAQGVHCGQDGLDKCLRLNMIRMLNLLTSQFHFYLY